MMKLHTTKKTFDIVSKHRANNGIVSKTFDERDVVVQRPFSCEGSKGKPSDEACSFESVLCILMYQDASTVTCVVTLVSKLCTL